MRANIIYIITIIFLSSCSKKQDTGNNSNRIYFTIPEEDRKIMIPVKLNDSVTVNLTFDTGAKADGIDLDSEVFASHPELVPKVVPDTFHSGVSWANSNRDIQMLRYNAPMKIKIGNVELQYDMADAMNWKWYMNNPKTDGIFNIPKNDTVNVWELNFEHNYLEIHPAENFTMPENSFILPFNPCLFYVQLPIKLQYGDGDTLTMNPAYYFIDTGMSWDIALMYKTKDIGFFNNKNDAVWTLYLDSYHRYYNVKATMFDNFVIDSLRIYTFDYPNRIADNGYLMGQHFLKHFNVFFDMKNKQVGLQPIKSFQRIVDPLAGRFHYLAPPNQQGKYVIKKIADNKENYFYTAGLKEGDEIVAINGILPKNISRDTLLKRDTLYYDIIRNGKPLKLVVHVNKDEVQGD